MSVDLPDLPEAMRATLKAQAGAFCVSNLKLALTLMAGGSTDGRREHELREAREAFLLVEDLRRRIVLDPADEEVVAALMTRVEEQLDVLHRMEAPGPGPGVEAASRRA